MKTKTILAGLLLVLTLSTGTAQAGDKYKPLKSKSVTTAWILALDPIPGDALLYAGKKGQGLTNAIVGGLFTAGFYGSLAGYLTEPDNSNDPHGYSGKDICRGLMIITGVPYLGFLIWDAIGGIHGVKKHNEHVENLNSSIWRSIQPTLTVSNQGFMAGAQVSF